MRDWTKLLLMVCVVALGAGMFLLERRISGLEAELRATRMDIAAVTPSLVLPPTVEHAPRVADSERVERHPQLRVVVPRELPAQRIEIAPPARSLVTPRPVPRLERQPSGVINGVPYYLDLLSQAD